MVTAIKETCEILSLAWKPTEEGVTVEADGFIVRKRDDPKMTFKKSPVMFLRVLLTKIRRDCEGIDKTHWGRILGGEIMKKSDFSENVGNLAGHSLALTLRLRN